MIQKVVTARLRGLIIRVLLWGTLYNLKNYEMKFTESTAQVIGKY